MLLDAPVFAVFLAAVVALTITPGPDMVYVASRALGQGRAAGVLSTFGVITSTFVHLGLAALGLAELFRHAAWATGCAAIPASSAFTPGSPPRSWPVSRSGSRCRRTDNVEPLPHG